MRLAREYFLKAYRGTPFVRTRWYQQKLRAMDRGIARLEQGVVLA